MILIHILLIGVTLCRVSVLPLFFSPSSSEVFSFSPRNASDLSYGADTVLGTGNTAGTSGSVRGDSFTYRGMTTVHRYYSNTTSQVDRERDCREDGSARASPSNLTLHLPVLTLLACLVSISVVREVEGQDFSGNGRKRRNNNTVTVDAGVKSAKCSKDALFCSSALR